jgi:serpin B
MTRMHPLALSSCALAADLYALLRHRAGNLAISPASISIALAMASGGARGETETQLRQVMHVDLSREAVVTGWGQLARQLRAAELITLRFANRIFAERTYALEPDYTARSQAAFGAAPALVDFRGAAEAARGQINAWVEAQTEQRIRDLIPAGAVDGETRLVLVNAVYFLAQWATAFHVDDTFDEPFHLDADREVETPMMHASGTYRMAEAGGAKILELPYRGGAAAMLVVLPDHVEGLADIEASLSSAQLAAWTDALASRAVVVTLPRFEVHATPSLALGEPLVALGMVDPFDPDRADFTGIADPPDRADRLCISNVFHSAFVKVDERGTEAAAATATITTRGGHARQVSAFRADHPFLFLIVDRLTGLVLFVGRVVDPTIR